MFSGRAIVTGGAGFIGSHLVDILLARGFAVTVVDNLSSGRRENVSGAAHFHFMDVTGEGLADLFREIRPTVVFHLAAQVSVAASMASPGADAQTNIIGLINVVEAAAKAGAKRVVFSSSAAVYGDPERLPLDETARTAPTSPYGLSKLTAEHYLGLLAPSRGLEYAILRYGNVYGPRQSADGEAGVIAIFASCLVGGKATTIFGDGRQTRDFIYVEDVARATFLAGVKDDVSGQVLNISSGVQADILSVYRNIARSCGMDHEPAFGPARPGDIRDSLLDNAKARALLGWTPETALDAGLLKTVRFFREQAARVRRPSA